MMDFIVLYDIRDSVSFNKWNLSRCSSTMLHKDGKNVKNNKYFQNGKILKSAGLLYGDDLKMKMNALYGDKASWADSRARAYRKTKRKRII